MVAFAGSRNNVPQRLSRRPSRNPRWELQKVGAPLFADSEFNMTSGTISSPWNGRSFWSCSFRWRTSVDSDDRLISRRGGEQTSVRRMDVCCGWPPGVAQILPARFPSLAPDFLGDSAKVRDIRATEKACGAAKSQPYARRRYVPANLNGAAPPLRTDAGYNNRPNGGSLGGTMVSLGEKNAQCIHAHSSQNGQRRVC